MYRSAFNDFHSLIVSLTKCLVQTSIVQTTSRLRAQRLRNKKGSLPMIRPRDVYTAIDTLGMKRNGRERWRGVPRRCGLRVITKKLSPRGKHLKEVREVPWGEVERLMSSTAATKVETSAEPEGFKSRAARGGTPLPMHNLTISDSNDDDDDVVGRPDITNDDDSEYSEPLSDNQLRPSVRHMPELGDSIAGHESVPLKPVTGEPVHQLATLEDFDWEAGRLEESALWKTLGVQPATVTDSGNVGSDVKDMDIELHEKVTTAADDWRQLQEYRAPWEAYKTPVSITELRANRRPSSPMPVSYGSHLRSVGSASGDVSDPSSTTYSRRRLRKSKPEVELHARGTNEYAALQREDPEGSNVEFEASDTDTTSSFMGGGIVAQSIEPKGDTGGTFEADQMEWT
jgi:RNA polymerase I-specific transcription initiation factor RRN5